MDRVVVSAIIQHINNMLTHLHSRCVTRTVLLFQPSSNMLTHLGLGLRATQASKTPLLGCSTLSQIWSVGNPFHSLAPAALSVSSHSHRSLRSRSAVAVPPQTFTTTNASLSVNLRSGISDWNALSRGFGTSPRLAAKEPSEKGDVVYRGAISGMIKGVKVFSLSTSLIGVCLQPMLIFSNQELPAGLKFAIGGVVNFFVFMNPFIIHYIAKKYVTELRWNRVTGVFTAVTWSLFVRRRELQFTAGDVRVPDVPGMFTFLEAKGTPLFLDPQSFEDNEAYGHLMGFDKPLDWELPQKPPAGDEPQKKER